MDRQLIEYLPDVLQQYAEFAEICRVEQTQVEQLWDNIDKLLLEGFLQDESEIGAAKWESILDIQPFDTDTLEMRNFRVRGRLLEEAPYTFRVLCDQIGILCGSDGYSCELNKDLYTLKIRVALKYAKMLEEVGKIAERLVPLNIVLDLDFMYNTHRMLKEYGIRHNELSKYTFGQIKSQQFY